MTQHLEDRPKAPRWRSSAALMITASCAAPVAVIALALSGVTTHAQPAPPSVSAADALLAVEHILPSLHARAAAGAGAEDFDALHAAAATEPELVEAFISADAALAAASQARAAAEEAVWRRGPGQGRAQAVAAARAQEAAARTARDQARAALRAELDAALTARLGAENIALMQRVDANSNRNTPLRYHALELSEEAWSALELALEKQRTGAALTTADTDILAIANSSAAVSLADSRIAANLPALEAQLAAALAAAHAEP